MAALNIPTILSRARGAQGPAPLNLWGIRELYLEMVLALRRQQLGQLVSGIGRFLQTERTGRCRAHMALTLLKPLAPGGHGFSGTEEQRDLPEGQPALWAITHTIIFLYSMERGHKCGLPKALLRGWEEERST